MVTKPWIRATSNEGFEDVVMSLMAQADELVAKAEEGSPGQSRVLCASDTCSVEVLATDANGC